MKGRKPTPRNAREQVDGHTHREKHPARIGDPTLTLPHDQQTPAEIPPAFAAPEHLSELEGEIWDTIVRDLAGYGMLIKTDLMLLEELVTGISTMRAFRQELVELQPKLEHARQDRDWDTYEMLSGALKRARTGYHQMFSLVMKIAGEYGITPVSRMRLGLMKAQGAAMMAQMGPDPNTTGTGP